MGIVTRSDLLVAHRSRLDETHRVEVGLACVPPRRQGVTKKKAMPSST